jgi:subtilisin family serine protease
MAKVKPVQIAFLIAALLFFQVIFPGNRSEAQGTTKYFYRVMFTDKGTPPAQMPELTVLFSDKSVSRRIKNGVPEADYLDLPVNNDYINQVRELGLALKTKSRWMNSALFSAETAFNVSLIQSLPFVSDVKLVKQPLGKGIKNDKLLIETGTADIPPFDRQLTMVSGDVLHGSGYTGKGITIAILDAGFFNADYIPSLGMLRYDQRILGTYDFVLNSASVYNYHTHGTAVLSILAGKLEGQLEGTAPDASYWLLRTEDGETEFPVEEDYWAAGAEFADSVGADIISSSLGYYAFDDPAMSYKFSDMDGNTTFVTRAADIAASRGILVVASAGNERNKPWKRIIAPSDGDSVIATGAVDGNRIISSFSSAGPSADRRVKPDVSAQGVSVALQTDLYSVVRGNGTSFSCPVISGLCAGILQAFPSLSASELVSELKNSADRKATPDSLYGYGIPDFGKIVANLRNKQLPVPEAEIVAGPNPTPGEVRILFREEPQSLVIKLSNATGRVLASYHFDNYLVREFVLKDLSALPAGLYFISVQTGAVSKTLKIIKTGP